MSSTPSPIDRSVGFAWSSFAWADVVVQHPGRANRIGIDDSAFVNGAPRYLGKEQPAIIAAPGLVIQLKTSTSTTPEVYAGVSKQSALWEPLLTTFKRWYGKHFHTEFTRLWGENAAAPTRPFRWIKPDSSFRLGALALGVVEVERRAFDTAGDDSNEDIRQVDRSYLGRYYSAIPRLVLDSLNAGLTNIGTMDEQFIRTLRSMATSQGEDPDMLHVLEQAMLKNGPALGSISEILRCAMVESLLQTRVRLHTGIVVCGVTAPNVRRGWWWLGIDAARTARTTHRAYVMRRCAVIDPPGRVVTASARICRGPNLADGSLTSNRLRGLHIRW